MTYPESEIRRVLKEQRYWSISDDELIKAMKPTSDSDRERVRMELWKDVYSKYIVDTKPSDSEIMANGAVSRFDKQFPNS